MAGAGNDRRCRRAASRERQEHRTKTKSRPCSINRAVLDELSHYITATSIAFLSGDDPGTRPKPKCRELLQPQIPTTAFSMPEGLGASGSPPNRPKGSYTEEYRIPSPKIPHAESKGPMAECAGTLRAAPQLVRHASQNSKKAFLFTSPSELLKRESSALQEYGIHFLTEHANLRLASDRNS